MAIRIACSASRATRSEAEIKRAYRALAKRNHPDAGQGSVARFLEIQAAYETLVGGDRPGATRRPGSVARHGRSRRAVPPGRAARQRMGARPAAGCLAAA